MATDAFSNKVALSSNLETQRQRLRKATEKYTKVLKLKSDATSNLNELRKQINGKLIKNMSLKIIS